MTSPALIDLRLMIVVGIVAAVGAGIGLLVDATSTAKDGHVSQFVSGFRSGGG